MNGSNLLNKKVLGGLVGLLLVGGGGLCWMERTPLLTWYYVRNLAPRLGRGPGGLGGRVAGLGEPALDDVLDCLPSRRRSVAQCRSRPRKGHR